MTCYFAPMEGITGYIFRNAHHSVFHNTDKYFTPFIVPNQNRRFTHKELNDVLPGHNQGMALVPQILSNKADDFIWAAMELKGLGYEEVNLNLGCPSGTVVSKNRGSGFLGMQKELDEFLDRIFTKLACETEISVKTRIGKDSPEEFYQLIELFNKYPLKELIIHPRIQKDYYKNHPNLEVFGDAVSISKNPVCYNGDIFSVGDYEAFRQRFPQVEHIMLGRGMIANPRLADEIFGSAMLNKAELKRFHDAVYHGYQEVISGDRNVLFKMKELWFYMLCIFSESRKYGKRIKKAERQGEYEAAVDSLFAEQEIVEGAGFVAP